MTVFYHWLWPGNVTKCLAKKEGIWSIDGWLAGGVRPVNINEWSPAKSEVHGMDSKTHAKASSLDDSWKAEFYRSRLESLLRIENVIRCVGN